MDAYHKVKDGVKYPAVLLTTGANDPRVEPWMSAKMAARLQAATSSGRPVLLRIDYDAGHGVNSTKRQQNEQRADMFAFLFEQLGSKRGDARERVVPNAVPTAGARPNAFGLRVP
jgi:prolyl oligopeptidase